ncbi:MAG: sigma-70 family RNA polymerase sigma factor [Bryobacteraceae bacterium]
MVHGVLLSRVPPADVDDVAQEIFLQAWRRLSSLRDPLAFGGWIRQIALHQSASHMRSARHTEPLDCDVALPPDGEGAWFLLAQVRRLPEAYREIMMMRFVEGLTGPEIAEQTGLTADSVRVNLHRGVKLLRAQLGPETS